MVTNRTHPDRRTGGFTMAEILATLLILGILTSLAAPSLAGFIDRSRTRRALDHLVGDITHARMLAVQQARPVRVNLNTNASYTIDTLSANATWGTLKSVDLQPDYRGVELSGIVNQIVFSSRGILTAASDTGRVVMTKNAARDSAMISGVGRIYRGY